MVTVVLSETVEFYNTNRGQIGALFNGQKFYKNYQGSDGAVSWICGNRHLCKCRIRTKGHNVIFVSENGHSPECIEADLVENEIGP